jgi:chaperonin GroEL (HSP60 family)
MMGPTYIATGLGSAMSDAVMSIARNARRTQDARVLGEWSNALSSARGDAEDMADLAVAAIHRVADLEAEVARLRRAVRHRDSAIKSLRQ